MTVDLLALSPPVIRRWIVIGGELYAMTEREYEEACAAAGYKREYEEVCAAAGYALVRDHQHAPTLRELVARLDLDWIEVSWPVDDPRAPRGAHQEQPR